MRQTLLGTVFVVMSVTTAVAQKRAVTFDDVMQLKAVASAAVSPDGTQVLFTVR